MIKPEDVLKIEENYADFNGKKVRKGTIAAAIKNVKEYEKTTDESLLNDLADLKEDLDATGLHEVVTWNNDNVRSKLQSKKITKHWVVLTPVGGGKSTFLNYLKSHASDIETHTKNPLDYKKMWELKYLYKDKPEECLSKAVQLLNQIYILESKKLNQLNRSHNLVEGMLWGNDTPYELNVLLKYQYEGIIYLKNTKEQLLEKRYSRLKETPELQKRYTLTNAEEGIIEIEKYLYQAKKAGLKIIELKSQENLEKMFKQLNQIFSKNQ